MTKPRITVCYSLLVRGKNEGMRGGWLKIHCVPTLRKTSSTEAAFLLSLCLSGHTGRDRVLSAQENHAQLWVLT